MNTIIKLVLTISLTINAALANTVIEAVIPFAPGGASGKIGHAVASSLTEEFRKNGYELNVVHKPGAGGMIGAAYVAKTPKKQIRLLISSSGFLTSKLWASNGPEYNLDTDFFTLGYLGHAPLVILTHSESKFKTIEQLKNACHSDTHIKVGSAGAGTNTHLSLMIFLTALGCTDNNIIHVAYQGSSPAISDLLGKHIDISSDFLLENLNLIKSNRLIPLVLLDNQRSSELSHIQTFKEVTNKNYKLHSWFIVASNSTENQSELEKIQQLVDSGLTNPKLISTLKNMNLVSVGTSVDKFFLKNQVVVTNSILRNIKNQ
jgi:tripartite-type tricarboxylate transporter receptor subunit TctC